MEPAKTLKVLVYTVGEAKSPLYPKTSVNRLLKEECAKRGITLTDWHLHIRGGMTPEMALQRERDTLRGEIAAHERERAKTAAELQRMTEKAAALQKAGKRGEDRINEHIKKSGDPCLGRRPDDAMLNLLREQLPHHPE